MVETDMMQTADLRVCNNRPIGSIPFQSTITSSLLDVAVAINHQEIYQRAALRLASGAEQFAEPIAAKSLIFFTGLTLTSLMQQLMRHATVQRLTLTHSRAATDVFQTKKRGYTV
jgi:hypothetical protein